MQLSMLPCCFSSQSNDERVLAEILCNHVKKNQLDAQLILSIFRQRLHVSGLDTPEVGFYFHDYVEMQGKQNIKK